jgi:hypothetical protein
MKIVDVVSLSPTPCRTTTSVAVIVWTRRRCLDAA